MYKFLSSNTGLIN